MKKLVLMAGELSPPPRAWSFMDEEDGYVSCCHLTDAPLHLARTQKRVFTEAGDQVITSGRISAQNLKWSCPHPPPHLSRNPAAGKRQILGRTV